MITEVSMSAIDCTDSFFDTFRGFYPQFNDWFRRQSDDGRHAWIHWDSSGNIDGFRCMKIETPTEDYSDFEKPFEPGIRLKICSLKSMAHGTGLGRLLISKALNAARAANVDGVYITVFSGTPETDGLISLLVKMGFVYWCRKGGECVYLCSVFNKMK